MNDGGESEGRAVSNDGDDVGNVDYYYTTLITNNEHLFDTISGGVSKLKSDKTTPDRA